MDLWTDMPSFTWRMWRNRTTLTKAVYEVVNFYEMKHNPVNKEYSSDYKQKRPTRAVKYHGETDVTDHMVQPSDDDSDQEEKHDDRIARVPAKTNKSRPITRAMEKTWSWHFCKVWK